MNILNKEIEKINKKLVEIITTEELKKALEDDKMNKINLIKKRNETANLFDFDSKRHRNCFKLNIHNSLEHELLKFIIFYMFRKHNKELLTEAKTKDGKVIVDIVNLDDKEVYEICVSETKEKFMKKIKKLPKELEVFEIRLEDYSKKLINDLKKLFEKIYNQIKS